MISNKELQEYINLCDDLMEDCGYEERYIHLRQKLIDSYRKLQAQNLRLQRQLDGLSDEHMHECYDDEEQP